MIILEVIILGFFTVLSVYLIFVHYKLVHRDYVQDLNKMLFNHFAPILRDYQEFVTGVKSDIDYQSEQIIKQMKEQRSLIESQSRIIHSQNDLLEKNRSIYVEQIEALKRENKFLYDDLKKTQNTLLKFQKKETRGNLENPVE
jgi:hypothetical protein